MDRAAGQGKTDLFKRYSKGILIPVILAVCVIAVGFIDGGTQAGDVPVTKKATVKTIVILEDGNMFEKEEEKNVTMYTYGYSDATKWIIGKIPS